MNESIVLAPLPANIIEVMYYRYKNGSNLNRYKVPIPINGTAHDLRMELAKLVNDGEIKYDRIVPAHEIVLGALRKHCVLMYLPDSVKINQTRSENLSYSAFETPGLAPQDHSLYSFQNSYTCLQYQKFIAVRIKTVMPTPNGTSIYLHGKPFVVPFDKSTTTHKQLYHLIFATVKRYFIASNWPQTFNNEPEQFFATSFCHMKWDSSKMENDAEISAPCVPYDDALCTTSQGEVINNVGFYFDSFFVKNAVIPNMDQSDDHSSVTKNMTSSQTTNIGMFWDLDSCPREESMLLSFTQALGKYIKDNIGGIMTEKSRVYTESCEISSSSRTQLFNYGSTINHVPRVTGHSSATGRTMMLDVCEFCLNNPIRYDGSSPIHIIVISGDADLAPMVNRLAQRGYDITVICNKDQSLKEQISGNLWVDFASFMPVQ